MVKLSELGRNLTTLEHAALKKAICAMEIGPWREAMAKQVDLLRVANRTVSTVGFYVDFEVLPRDRISGLPDEINLSPPQVEARHPDGVNAIFFIVYVKDGALSFMEAASTSDWPKDESGIVFPN